MLYLGPGETGIIHIEIGSCTTVYFKVPALPVTEGDWGHSHRDIGSSTSLHQSVFLQYHAKRFVLVYSSDTTKDLVIRRPH
jgi:hypothetical protein